MTALEALRILEEEGNPLHYREITKCILAGICPALLKPPPRKVRQSVADLAGSVAGAVLAHAARKIT